MKQRKLLLVFGLVLTIGLVSGTYFTNTDFFIEKELSSAYDNNQVPFEPIKIDDPVKKFDSYKSAWKEIDSLSNKGLYKSAAEKIDVLVGRAKKEENHPMIIKGYLYKIQYDNITKEDNYKISIQDLENLANEAKAPSKQIAHFLLAKVYWGYYNTNSWNINNRTELDDYNKNDIAEWPKSAFVHHALKNLYAAISDSKELKSMPIENLEQIVTDFTQNHISLEKENLRERMPTVYDLLARSVLDVFEQVNFELPKSSKQFIIDYPEYYGSANDFLKVTLPKEDSLNPDYHVMGLYQDLTEFHLMNKNESALLDVTKHRLAFVHSKSTLNNKEELYNQAIDRVIANHSTNEISAEFNHIKASRLSALAMSSSLQNKEHQFKNNDALKICENVQKKFPKSLGAKECAYLENKIYQRAMEVTGESYIIPNYPSRYNVSVKNIDKIYTKLLAIDFDTYQKKYVGYQKEENFLNYVRKEKPLYESTDECPSQKDFLQHSYEFGLPKLNKGFYILVVSSSPEFETKEEIVKVNQIIVTDLNLRTRKGEGGSYDFLVTKRTSGEPVYKAKIKVWAEKYNYRTSKYTTVSYGTVNSDANGKATFKTNSKNRRFQYSVSTNDDELPVDQSFYLYKRYQPSATTQTSFFLDRGIYRPGQKLFFKGIVRKNDGNGNIKLIKNKETTVELRDPNWEIVKEIKVKSNEFGSYSGEIDLPIGRLNGRYTIKDAFGSKSLRVEEYKRPKFETEFKTIETEFKLNDSVEVIGFAKAFAGNMIDGADVKYEVTRTTNYPYWGSRYWSWFPKSPPITMLTGETKSDEKGEYTVKFKALPDLAVNKKYQPNFNYSIVATVTDVNGETHEAVTNVRVGYTSMVLTANISESYGVSGKDSVSFSTRNLNGGDIKAKGKYVISRLKKPEQILRSSIISNAEFRKWTKKEFEEKFPLDEYQPTNKNDWEVDKKVESSSFVNDEYYFLNKKKWGIGVYKIEAESKDKEGNTIKDVNFFTIFDAKSKKVASHEDFFVKRLNQWENEPGDVAKFLVGSSYKKYNFLFEKEIPTELQGKNKIVETKWYKNQSGQQIIEIPILELDRKGIALHFTLSKNARNQSVSQHIYVSQKHKSLRLAFTTFRDKLLPGQKEKWTINIKSGYGEKVAAELLATLYDKSLDEFASNYFSLSNGSYFYSTRRWAVHYSHGTSYSRTISTNLNPYKYWPSITYPQFNLFGADRFFRGRRLRLYNLANSRRLPMVGGENDIAVRTGGVLRAKNSADKVEEIKKEAEKKSPPPPPSPSPKRDDLAELEVADASSISQTATFTGGLPSGGKDNALKSVKARSNFSETAFFFPHMRTNENGDVLIEFTIPESLTKWKFMALAHTQDGKVGTLNDEIVTQKELMVVPNTPRFFREGDVITLSSKITNLSGDSLPSQVKLTLIDPFTEKDITDLFKIDEVNKSFELAPKRSNSVSWNLKVPEYISAVAVKIVAIGGKHSDGERKTIPILSNRMLVTESMPMSVRKIGTHEFTFDKLVNNSSKSLKHHNLTLEFTENPAWYAIQAMPYMMEYPYECAEQTFTRYYSNAIATHIMNSSPKIKEVINSWKTESPDAFLSNLEKNQELKSLLLEETPWVLQANSETQRKKNIALLFDMARMERESARAMRKILNKQTVNGGWSWFPGMPENRYITQHIVTGLGHLKQLEVEHQDGGKIQKMTKKAIGFLDEKLLKDYNWMKRHQPNWEKNNYISSTQIQYLYARSYFKDIEIPKNIQKAFDYYMKSAEKKWLDQSLYTQGMISLFMHRYDKQNLALDITKSLKERSIESKEFGRYWKELNTGGYYWYQAPIETQSLMIELFDEVAKDEEMVEDLKVWLLKQKQTTDWKTTKATAEACYALLLRGTEVLTTENTMQIYLGNKKVVYNQLASSPNEIGVKTQKGTGYFKHQFKPNEILENYGNVKIEKSTNSVSWGSMYWQYWEDLDKITFHKTPLHLEKELYVVTNDGNGEKMKRIDEKEIKVGDKVRVRIVLRSDRNLEFVHMKDMRASGFEPTNVISRYKYKDGLGYYESTKDASTNFFFDYIPKGTYVFEYDLRASHAGQFSNGIATIQCMYAPEFTSHSNGIRLEIK